MIFIEQECGPHIDRLLSPDDEAFVAQTAITRPAELGQPFTRWSIRELLDYLHRLPGRTITIGRKALRTLLARHGLGQPDRGALRALAPVHLGRLRVCGSTARSVEACWAASSTVVGSGELSCRLG
ncbi:hypothetical protein [Sphaerisporangium fuscum]|uniref:hypothetical protein n=1 Tax=Sphaerisporangium fuscum TaxID=2835868 RepID=UPI001BDCCA58|nr:hypothetical protein [Sphaerisporangium fuscum]